jgi:uncharacterized protein YybS (DUF2232 family)
MNDSPNQPSSDPTLPSAASGASDAQELEDEAAWQELETELAYTTEPAAVETEPERESRSANLLDRVIDPSNPLIMVETAFLASAASLIWLVNYYFPLGPVLRVFFPIPIALIYLRWHNRAAWMGCLVSGLLLSVLMGPVRSILYVMPFGLMGVLLGVLWRRRARWAVSVSLGALLATIGFFFRIWLVSLLLGDDLWLYATTQVTDLLEWVFVRLGWVAQPTLWLVQLAIVLMVIVQNILYLFVVHLVAWFLLDRLGNPIPRPPKWVQVLLDYE